jgi:hypothetical protein
MAQPRRSVGELVAMGVIAGLLAYGLAFAARPRGAPRPPTRISTVLSTRSAVFELHPGPGRLSIHPRQAGASRDVDLAIVVDGVSQDVHCGRDAVRPGPGSLRATVPIVVDDVPASVELVLRVDEAHDAVNVELTDVPDEVRASHAIALRAGLSSDGQVVFVPGRGPVADRVTLSAVSVVIEGAPRPLAIASPTAAESIDVDAEEGPTTMQPVHVSVTTPDVTEESTPDAATSRAAVSLDFVLGQSSVAIWRSLAELAGVPTGIVRGRVTGAAGRPLVIGRDSRGGPRVRFRADEGGSFSVEAPLDVVEWYAAMDAGRASSLYSFVPGTRRDLVLDVSPGGDLHVSITDPDTGAPLTARLFVRGIDGTVDPSFGPDYRASGAGPIIDALRGDVTTPLPSGRYKVAATKGIEWSVDSTIVDISPGRVAEATLSPRHVVPTPGVLGCDLHVHARPSFDTPVTVEDRVLSLAAAGVDFAVPTEHNTIGDYGAALDSLDLRSELLSVSGVEVTTVTPQFGHFGVFPYPVGTKVPPFRHTTMNAIFRAVRAGDPNRYFQLNHPRLPNIGYFSLTGFDPLKPRMAIPNRVDFDGIEIYNGYDDERPERVDQVLRDYWALLSYGWRYVATGSSDSHRIQFHWAGYPRTMVTFDPRAESETADRAVDPLTIVSHLKKGHAVVTSGPMIELDIGGVHPGDEIVSTDPVLHGHLKVRAAPWIDVAHVEIMVGQVGGTCVLAKAFDVPSVPTKTGPEPGTLAEASERTVRFDQDIDVEVGPENGWVQVIVRGKRPMDDVLPFMPVPPLALANPVYVVRRREAPPPFPWGPARR